VQTRWDKDPSRVLAFDDQEVFYDSWWPTLNSWTFGIRRSAAVYYRMDLARFLDSAVKLDATPLTQQERALHRPDLPLRVYRELRFSWDSGLFSDRAEFVNALQMAGMDAASMPPLDTTAIVIVPQTAKRHVKTGVLISAESGLSLSGVEVLWGAYCAQAPYQRWPSRGIGLYRHGLRRRGIPSYIIGGFSEIYSHPPMTPPA
jgi:hypothetical protein